VILLDTEGLSDPVNNDQNYDAKIFALGVVTSSIFIFNSTSAINATSIDSLRFDY